MEQKAFPQVYRVLGINPVHGGVWEGRIERPLLPLISHIYLLLCLSYTLRKVYALENIRDQLHQVGCFAQLHSPGLHSIEKYTDLGNFTCECTIYEAMIFRGFCWRKLTIAERILTWGSKDQEQIEARELAWMWSWLMQTSLPLGRSRTENCCSLSENPLGSWMGGGVVAENLFCFL